jgi:hypothetical protein
VENCALVIVVWSPASVEGAAFSVENSSDVAVSVTQKGVFAPPVPLRSAELTLDSHCANLEFVLVSGITFHPCVCSSFSFIQYIYKSVFRLHLCYSSIHSLFNFVFLLSSFAPQFSHLYSLFPLLPSTFIQRDDGALTYY